MHLNGGITVGEEILLKHVMAYTLCLHCYTKHLG
jgi:hypothetical protein